MPAPPESIKNYFRSVELAFGALERIFETEGIWVKRHNLIYETVRVHLEQLQHAFTCWNHNIWFADAFRVDTTDSGFPLFRHVLQLENDLKKLDRMLAELPEPDQIKDEMVEQFLKYKKFPHDLQKTMGQRLYYSALEKARIFNSHTPSTTIAHSYNPRARRPYYVMHWACYDGSHNLPIIYMAVIEDSSHNAPKPVERKAGPWGEMEVENPYLGPGLPNRDLAEDFEKFIAAHSQYSLNLTSIATAMDADFPTLHPKQLRRFILGPLHIGGLTQNREKLQQLLNTVKNTDDNWVLTWTLQELHSKEETTSKNGIWGASVPKEIYYINTADPDCVQQGASTTQAHALIPHEVYQKAYASDGANDIFKDYQCYIASGEHILRHV